MCVDRLQCREPSIKHGPNTSFEGRCASSSSRGDISCPALRLEIRCIGPPLKPFVARMQQRSAHVHARRQVGPAQIGGAAGSQRAGTSDRCNTT
jgi:hypothetical protein